MKKIQIIIIAFLISLSACAIASMQVQASGSLNHFVFDTVGPQAVGKSFTLTVTAQDSSGDNITDYIGVVNFTSTDSQAVLPSNYTFASSDNGMHSFSVTLNTVGSETISVTDSVAGISSKTDPITVEVAPSVNVSPSSVTIDVGQSTTFTASASGGSESYPSYKWYVNAVAQSGTASTMFFTPASSGSYSITATVTDSLGVTSALSSAATVTVNQLTITLTQTANGQITPATSPVNVNYDATPTFSITPNTGYYIASITADGASVSVTSSSGQPYQFSAVSAAGSLTATYAPNMYTFTVITVGQGTVSPGNGTYPYGTIVNLTATSASGWTFGGWSNDATSNTTKVTMNQDELITAYFIQNIQTTPTPTLASTPTTAPASTPTPTPNPNSTPVSTTDPKAKSTATTAFSLASMGEYLSVIATAIILAAIIVGLFKHRKKPPNIIILN